MPTTTLEGDASGAPHPDPTSYAGRFGTTCPHRTMVGGIGHNLSQEAPEVFTDAVFTVGALR
jgi:hypothetical protein